jgi:hypothetical protein
VQLPLNEHRDEKHGRKLNVPMKSAITLSIETEKPYFLLERHLPGLKTSLDWETDPSCRNPHGSWHFFNTPTSWSDTPLNPQTAIIRM